MKKNILWLPGWYPNILSPYDGDFIQRHARAVALIRELTVIYVKKDEKGVVTKNVKTIYNLQGNVREIIVYYHSLKTGISLLDKILSSAMHKKVFKKELSNYIEEHGKPDLAHVHVVLKAGLLALWLKEQFQIPFIISEHWTGYLPEAKFGVKNMNFFQKKSMQKIFDESQTITVVSDVLGKAIANQFRIKGYKLVANTVNTSIFYPDFSPANSPVHFIHVSSLAYQKNVAHIIEAFSLVKQKGYNFRLLIIGPLKKELAELVIKMEMQHFVTYNYEVPQDEVASYLRKSDALILYSHYETFGCVVIEANACGIPAILSDLPVFREYISENENGVFVAPGKPAELANTLENFILGKYPFNKQSIAEKTAQRFNYGKIGKEFVAIYENLSRT
jgi:glycosyltransferase involved in cell wall biosynthesis